MKNKTREFTAFICAIAILISAMAIIPVNATEEPESYELIGKSYGLDLEVEQEYFEEFVAPKIASGELTPYRPTASISRSTTDIPSSCDNSTSPYFPAIGDQGQIGSCVAFATTYYQFTYEANRLKDITTTPDNTCSPQWTYSHTNYGVDNGSRFIDAYYSLSSIGSIRYGDYEDGEIVTDEDFVTHWSTNTPAAIEALSIKGNEEDVIFGEFSDLGSPTGLAITFDTNTESDDYLDGLKAGLANGHIYTFGCNFYYNEMTASSQGTHAGEKVAVRNCYMQDEEGNRYNNNHAVTIVGYDDNICVDLNGDGTIESAEKGAFKVANSWGTNWGNDGYIWVLYDSLNKVTQHSDPSWDDSLEGPYRLQFIDRQRVFKLNVYENTNEVFVIFDYKTDYKFNIDVYTYRSENGSAVTDELDYTNPQGKSNNGRLLYAPFDGQIVLDHAQSSDTIEDYYTGALWSLGTYFIDELDHNTINSTEFRSITYVDNKMNVIKSYVGDLDDLVYDPSYLDPIAGMYWTEFDTNIDLIIGDINYDNTLDANDITLMRRIISGIDSISSLQYFLADLNEDGKITAHDSWLLNQLINNPN